HELRRRLPPEVCGGVARDEGRWGSGAGQSRGVDRLGGDLDAGHLPSGRREVVGEATDTAVEVRDRRDAEGGGPVARRPVQRLGDRGVRLEEAADTEVQGELVDPE